MDTQEALERSCFSGVHCEEDRGWSGGVRCEFWFDGKKIVTMSRDNAIQWMLDAEQAINAKPGRVHDFDFPPHPKDWTKP